MERLPYIDEHRTSVGATADVTWAALCEVARPFLEGRAPWPIAQIWRLEPPSGFATVDEKAPHRLTLRGRHRFSRYELAFAIDDAKGGVVVCARTSAVFPGPHGRLYRALVIGSGSHRVAVRRILRRIAGKAEGMARASYAGTQ